MNRKTYKTLVLLAAFWLAFASGMKAQENMLCQGRHWTEDEANLKMKEFAQSWNDRESWEKRATVVREGIIEGMKLNQMPERSSKLNVTISNARKMDGYVVENFIMESFPGFYITGNLYRPHELKSKNPAILCPHGHLKDKRLKADVQIRSAAFARMGAIVVAYDMVGFADSKQVTHDIPIALVLQTYNSQRVLDYLLSRGDVDPERIGVTGGSGGGTQTFMLAAIDDRIKVSAPVVQVSAHFFGGCVCESGMPVHKSDHHQTNNVEIAALCAPRPMLIVSNGGDWTSNTPLIEYPYIQKVYALYNAEHKAENVHLPLEKHDYGPSKRFAVYNFFAHHLGLDKNKLPYNYGYDESFVTVLEPDELRVFNKKNQLPANALQGNKAVMKYLNLK
ncbi:acetylxylan esterase [Maribellus luteus]|uniref:Acetylxylan esterase n=1 Tax=Maribellus luteus TaxID=2305463 RepID=A0A399SW02_9BACT|nr:acetylxylan esterase [Maribellus luteus]RIJ46969.1 acetylxylan esterase [Maribellus luteus]